MSKWLSSKNSAAPWRTRLPIFFVGCLSLASLTSCSNDVVGCAEIDLYWDEDGDSFGGSISVHGCLSPSPGWVPNGGDCNDKDTRVFPGSLAFYDTPYATPNSNYPDSFDFDCNGSVSY